MEPLPDLTICIVNHRTPDLLYDCLHSIYATASDLVMEVLVVNNTLDNDDEFSKVMASFPCVCAIQNVHALGFAANQNQMLRRARGRYLIPLNSDTVIHTGALQELVRFMEANPLAGLAGPRLVYDDGQLQPSCRNFPALLSAFMEVTGLWRLFKNNRWMAKHIGLCNPHTEIMEVDWLSGACYIVRREVVEQVGGYDDVLFIGMYGEDIEWCWRIRRAGWRIMFDPAAIVTHLESKSAAPDRLYAMYEGSVKFMHKSCSPIRDFGVRMIAAGGVALRWLGARDSQERSTYQRVLLLLLLGRPAV